jgi:hypothetical protein
MTLLSIVQDAALHIGIPEPAAVASSTATDAQQLLRLLNAGARQLMKDHHWSKLLKVKTFVGVATQAQTGQPPANFDRFAPMTQLWDTDKRLPVRGAISAEKWLLLLAQNVTGSDKYWTMIDGVINITPVPTTSDDFRYTYVSRYFARPTGETVDTNDKAAFSIDTDESRLSEELLTLDLVWRWKKAKQLDYAEDLADFERQKEMDIAADRAAQPVSMAHDVRGGDGWWPGTITQV